MISLWVAFFVVCLAMFFMKRLRPRDKELPGPPAIPILGNVLQMITAIQTYDFPFSHFAEKYGEIYRLKIPFDEIVVLASYEAVQGVLSKEESTGRDVSGIMADRSWGQNMGIIFANGQMWDRSRKWAFKNLREFGFGKALLLEVSVKEEIRNFLKDLEKNGNTEEFILPIRLTFLVPVSRVMYKMVAGIETKIETETLTEMNLQTSLMEKASGLSGTLGGALAIYFPAIRYIFPDWTGRSVQLSCRSVFQTESRKLLAASKKRMSQPNAEARSLSEKFVEQMNVGDKDSFIFTELNHDILFADMFQAASSTTASYLEVILLYLIVHPDIQENIYREVQAMIPRDQEISYEDKSRLVYTHAVMLEVHRVSKIFQNLVPRRTIADFEYKNFKIKKNTMLVADINSLYANPDIFEDPMEFKPERFLDPNGNVINQKLIVSFSVGKRSCPGEQFADLTSFLFFLNLIRKYKLSTVPGEPKPRTDLYRGIAASPYPFSLLLTKRGST